MLENPYFHDEDAKQERCYWRRVAAISLCGFGFVIALGLVIYPLIARAEPIAQTTAGNVQVFLHNEPCKLAEIKNLANRATWVEGGATFEGCFGVSQETGVVIAYFTDKTVVAIPISAFARVHRS